jgi:hypothetical protein
MSLTVDQLVFGAPSMNFEVIEEVFILIRIRYHDKTSKETQLSDLYRYIVQAIGETKEYYMDRKPGFRVLCGSI